MAYTHKDDKTIENWPFHPDYFEEGGFLPRSIQNELVKRLTECARNPLTVEQLKEVNPLIEVKLRNICNAYRNKQERSRQASRNRQPPKPQPQEEPKEEPREDKKKATESDSSDDSDSDYDDDDKFWANHREFYRYICELKRKNR
jgi:hypothetical protein